jgi:hypothetical protein
MATETSDLTVRDPAAVLDRAITAGDLSRLTPMDRVVFYRNVCESMGLNPLTKPFEYITLNGRLTLYATKTATDQLRTLRGISIDGAERDATDPDYATWLVTGHDASGRTDMEIGSVSIAGLKGEARANAIMKALTKGKRRLTLSLSGLGWLDETEVGSVPSAQSADVDQETGEIRRAVPLREQVAARRAEVTTRGEGDADTTPPAASLPRQAGARTATPPSDAGRVEAGSSAPAPTPATDEVEPTGPDDPADDASQAAARADGPRPSKCEGFSAELGRCVREAGHEGHHRSKAQESWR